MKQTHERLSHDAIESASGVGTGERALRDLCAVDPARLRNHIFTERVLKLFANTLVRLQNGVPVGIGCEDCGALAFPHGGDFTFPGADAAGEPDDLHALRNSAQPTRLTISSSFSRA